MDINYERYRVFYYVAKTHSFSEAASELYISQSAVSQSIKVLEKHLGRELFSRTTKKVELTKEGEMLFKHVEPAINLITRGENQIISSKAGMDQLRIAASDTICRYYLLPYLSLFHRKYPDIHLKVINGTSIKCGELLSTNQADIIISNSPNSAINNGMQIKKIMDFNDVFVANPEYFDVKGKKFTLSELLNFPILMLSKLSTTSSFMHSLFLKESLELVPAVELSSNDLLIDFAKIGLGITFVPDYCIKESSELEIIRLNEEIPSRNLVVAYDGNANLPESAKDFLDILFSGNK
jgi:DNA-binding transcriptional LysR family regulator